MNVQNTTNNPLTVTQTAKTEKTTATEELSQTQNVSVNQSSTDSVEITTDITSLTPTDFPLTDRTFKVGMDMTSGWSEPKEVNYDFVPDKLWDAFADTAGSEDQKRWIVNLFNLPKWKTGFDNSPPTLEKVEIDDEKMMSYDYISIINDNLKRIKADVQESTKNINIGYEVQQSTIYKKRDEENIVYLNSLKENLGKVLDYPLYTNNSKDDRSYYLDSMFDYDTKVQHVFENKTRQYAISQLNNEKAEAMKRAGIPLEYMPQLNKVASHSIYNDIVPEYTTYLMAQNSNTSGEWDPQTDMQKQMSEGWFKNYVADYYDELIASMGKPGEPNSKWMDPELYDILRRSEIAGQHSNGI